MKNNYIKFVSIINDKSINRISTWAENNPKITDLVEFLISEFQIDCTVEREIIQGFDRDSSNIKGRADALSRPVNENECALILATCQKAKIPITISAGRTNLNGSATPIGGMVLSIERMTTPSIKVDLIKQTLTSPVGIYLEEMRKEALKQSHKTLHYPVDPTSRKEAMVGGTLSCNASGFVPGPTGATRYWTESLDFLTLSGYKICCNRNEYISKEGEFILGFESENKTLKIPSYPRPNIKNASGPYSDNNGEIDFVDLIVGSEGIFGLITSVTFRLKAMPDSFLDLFFTLPSEEDAVRFYQHISDYFKGDLSNITAMEYFGYNCKSYMKNCEYLFNSENDVGIYLQIPLYGKLVEDVSEEWLQVLTHSGCGINEEEILLLNDSRNWQTFFEARHSIPVNALEKTRHLDTWSILTDTIVPPENFQELLDSAHSLLQKSEIEYLLFGHLGDCHLHFHLIPTKSQQPKALKVYDQIVEKSAELGGVYSAEHGTGKRKCSDFIKCYGNKGVQSLQKTKSVFDPDFLLNRGNVVDYNKINL